MSIESRIWLPNLPLEVLSHVALPGSSELQTEFSENLQALPIASNRLISRITLRIRHPKSANLSQRRTQTRRIQCPKLWPWIQKWKDVIKCIGALFVMFAETYRNVNNLKWVRTQVSWKKETAVRRPATRLSSLVSAILFQRYAKYQTPCLSKDLYTSLGCNFWM